MMQTTKKVIKKIRGSKGTLDLYKFYIKDIEPGNTLFVSRGKHGEILKRANELFSEYVLDFAYRVRLPFSLGVMGITKKRLNFASNRLPIDWENSRKYGRRIYHTNEHTNEYKYRWAWYPGTNGTKHASCYLFVPTRTNSRKLAALLKQGKDYPE